MANFLTAKGKTMASEELGVWKRQGCGQGAVVFLHGLGSNQEDCFTNSAGTHWAGIIENSKEFDGVGIYVCDYYTTILAGSYSIEDVVSSVFRRMSFDKVFDEPWVIFIAHSLGGIVARRLVISEQLYLTQAGTKFGFFFLASPLLGSSWARLRWLLFFLPHSQVDDLIPKGDNGYLARLRNEFLKLKHEENFKIIVHGVELTEDKFFGSGLLTLLPRIVSGMDAGPMFGPPVRIAKSNHGTIAKPSDSRCLQHIVLCQFLKEFRGRLPECRLSAVGALDSSGEKSGAVPKRELDQISSFHQGANCTIRRNDFLKKILELIEDSAASVGLRIISGSKGVGKTTLLRQVYDEACGNVDVMWYDASCQFLIPNIAGQPVILIDNLFCGHPLLTGNWEGWRKSKVVAVVINEDAQRECMAQAGQANKPEIVLRVKTFTRRETKEFLSATCNGATEEFCAHVHAITEGNPTALQICRARLNHVSAFDRPLISSEKGLSGLIEDGFEHWLAYQGEMKNLLLQVMLLLTNVPLFGIKASRMCVILGADEVALQNALAILHSNGFINFAGVERGADGIFYVPNLLKDIISERPCKDVSAWRAAYSRLTLQSKNASAFEVLDCWIVGWDEVFKAAWDDDSDDQSEFWRQLSTYESLVERAVKFEELLPILEARLTLLSSHVRNFRDLDCQFLIGLANTFRAHSMKRSPIVAMAIWPGAFSNDSWARASTLMCSMIHWASSGGIWKEEAILQLKKWTSFILKMAEEQRFYPEDDKHFGNKPDLDFFAAAIQFVQLEGVDQAISLFKSPVFLAVYPELSLAHLACLTAVLEGEDALRQTRLRELLEGLAPAAPGTVEKVYSGVCEAYVSTGAFGQELLPFKRVEINEPSATILNSLARHFNSERIRDVVSRKFPDTGGFV